MTSQSPADEERSTEYEEAWDAIQDLVMEQGGSWSGRERNCAYMSLGDGRFVNVSGVSGADYIDDSRAVLQHDWDGDGDLDLLVKGRTAPRVRVLRNRDESGAQFLQVALVGAGTNRDAIGAKVSVKAGGKLLSRRIYAGDGFLSQASKVLHFGLGSASEVQGISVEWPDGSRSEHEGLAANQRVNITQGEAEASVIAMESSSAFAGAAPRELKDGKRSVYRIPLVEKVPMGAVHLPSFEDPSRRVESLSGSPVLINLWASWCQNCLVEMRDFQSHRTELAKFGLQVVPMTTDDEEAMPQAHAILERFGLTDGAGRVNSTLQSTLEVLFSEVIGKPEFVSLPASLLLDSTGQLVMIYNGPVDSEQLLADLRILETIDPQEWNSTEFFDGEWLIDRKRAFGMMGRQFKAMGFEEMRQFYRGVARVRNQTRKAQREGK